MLTHSFPTRRSSDWLFETLTYQQLVLLSQTLDVAFRTRVTDLVLLILERLRKRTIVRGVGLELGGRGVESGFDAFHACASCGASDNSSASRSNVCPLSKLTVAITPSRGAAIVVSIFMLSITNSVCPRVTVSPTVTETVTMLPGIGATMLSSAAPPACAASRSSRSEEHTSELQSLMRISYAVFCLKKKHNKYINPTQSTHTPSPH